MNESSIVQIVVSTLSAVGISAVLTYILNRRKEIEFRIREQKEKRYRSCLLYMDTYFKPENIKYLSSRLPDIDTATDILAYLHMEYHEMMLYASKDVILSVKKFIDAPSRENFLAAIIAMRQDVWVKKNDLIVEDIQLSNPNTSV